MAILLFIFSPSGRSERGIFLFVLFVPRTQEKKESRHACMVQTYITVGDKSGGPGVMNPNLCSLRKGQSLACSTESGEKGLATAILNFCP